jgi:hypothetical protein
VGFFLQIGCEPHPTSDLLGHPSRKRGGTDSERYFGSGKYGVAPSGSGTLKTSRIIETPV